jgi:hypothetical protein
MKGLNSGAPSRKAEASVIHSPALDEAFKVFKTCSVLAYSEMTLLHLPWSGVDHKDKRLPISIALLLREDLTSFRGRAQWDVSCQGEALGGTYERSVFRALEWIALGGSLALGIPFANPLVVHPREICDRLCWKATQPEFKAIDRAMKRISMIRIRRLIPGKPGEFPVTQTMGLLHLSIQSTIRNVTPFHGWPNYLVYFDRFFVNSVNAGRILPLNWALWISLEDPIARRLLEILDFEFSHDGHSNPATIEVERLSSLVPLHGAMPLYQRRNLLERAHAILIREGYLARVGAGVSRGQSLFTYHAGPTYYAMRRRLESTMGAHSHRSPLWDALDQPSWPANVHDRGDGVPGPNSQTSKRVGGARVIG